MERREMAEADARDWSEADIREETSFLCCAANQVRTGHKLHFQPKNQARAKLAAINNKNGCATAEV